MAKNSMAEGFTLRPSQAVLAIQAAARANRVLFIKGPPGVGKSALTYQAAAAEGRKVYEVRANLLDPVDLRGLPSIRDGRTIWSNVPDFLPANDAGPSILFLDELPQAPALVQNALSQIILDRRIGDYRLPDACSIVIAGNRDSDRAATTRVPSHINGRTVHVTLMPNLEDWLAWALQADVVPEICAFLRWRPDSLINFDPSRTENATPRTWHILSDLLKTHLPSDIEAAMVAGTVGAGDGAEFSGFLRLWRGLPDFNDIIARPMEIKVPTEPHVLCAVATGLARKATAATMAPIMQYADRMPKEYGVMCVKDCVQRDPKLATNAAFRQFAIKNHMLLA